MPQTTVVAQNIVGSGLAPAFAAANLDGGSKMKVDTSERHYIEVINGDNDTACVVTIVPQQTPIPCPGVGPVDPPDIVASIAFGTREKIGPFPPAYIDNDGYVHWTYSMVDNVTVGGFCLARVAG